MPAQAWWSRATVEDALRRLLQRVLREDFSGCTRVAVAHRIHTIMDSDVIVVMDSGRIVEVGSPAELLRNEEGWFSQLAKSKE